MIAQPTPPADRKQKIELLRQRMMEANPEGDWLMGSFGPVEGPKKDIFRPAHLADVLAALWDSEDNQVIAVNGAGNFMEYLLQEDRYRETDVVWKINCDSLSDQSDETIDFLASLLLP